MSISNKALLVSMKISQWVGRKRDKQATELVENSYSSNRKVGNFNKKLLPGATELAEITSRAQALRMFFHAQTLPWCSDGSRILSAANYMQFTQEFNKQKDAFDAAVLNFILAYPALQQAAQAKLGQLYRTEDYPSIEKLHDAFRCEVHFFPIPEESDFRIQISEEEKAAFQKQMQEVEREANKDLWRRLYETVSKVASKLNDPEGIFRNSLIENITAQCSLLSRLNVTDDPNLENMRREVEALAAKTNPDSCRVSEVARKEAANKLNEIQSRMSAFMGN